MSPLQNRLIQEGRGRSHAGATAPAWAQNRLKLGRGGRYSFLAALNRYYTGFRDGNSNFFSLGHFKIRNVRATNLRAVNLVKLTRMNHCNGICAASAIFIEGIQSSLSVSCADVGSIGSLISLCHSTRERGDGNSNEDRDDRDDDQHFHIISFDSDILGLYDYLGEYENIDELNHLAHLLKELSPSERETLEAVMDSGQHCGSVQDLINLTQNLDCYDLHPGVDNEEMLGRLYVEDMESLEVPDNIKPYFDFEAYGRDISINENGHFAPGGYVTKVSDDFREVYHGPQDIPAEHRVFAYPQLSIREQMAAYQEIIDGSSKEGFRRLAEKHHEER